MDNTHEGNIDVSSQEATKAVFEEALAARTATYGFLQRLYAKEIDQEYLDHLATMRLKASTGNEKVDEAHRLFHAFMSSRWERTLSDLAVDFTNVFIGSGKSSYSAAYPFESVYRSEGRMLMQEDRDGVLAFYRAAGLKKLDSFIDCEDHIAAELEFLRIMAQRTLESYRADDIEETVGLLAVQQRFLREHLTVWLPHLVADMQKFAQTDFYRFLALFSEGFIETETEFLDDILTEDS